MPWNGSGTFAPLGSPEYPAVSGEIIYADYFNAIINDIIGGLNNCVTRDYQEGEFWLNATDPDKGAALVGYGQGVLYPENTVGEGLNDLFDYAKDLVGTANQVLITEIDATTLQLALSPTLVFPGTAVAVGFTNASTAGLGKVGEILTAKESTGIGLTVSGDNYDVVSLELQPGHYLVWGNVAFNPASDFAYHFLGAGISGASVTFPSWEYNVIQYGNNSALSITNLAVDAGLVPPIREVNVDVVTTIYLVAKANFTAGTVTAKGQLTAFRFR